MLIPDTTETSMIDFVTSPIVTEIIYSTFIVSSGYEITHPVLETQGEAELNVMTSSLCFFNTCRSISTCSMK